MATSSRRTTDSSTPAAASTPPASAGSLLTTNNDLLTVLEVMGILKVCRATVQRWCKQGWLPAVKIGKEYRIRRSDLEKWYNTQLEEQSADRQERYSVQEQAS